jgi:hypothetical protein
MRLDLGKDNAISLRGNNEGNRVRCDGGVVWVTQAGDPADYVLVKGEELTIRSRGTVIIEARRDAMVTVEGGTGPARYCHFYGGVRKFR